GILDGFLEGVVLGPGRRRLISHWERGERHNRVIPAGPKFALAQLLECVVDVWLVFDEVKVCLGAHDKLLPQLMIGLCGGCRAWGTALSTGRWQKPFVERIGQRRSRVGSREYRLLKLRGPPRGNNR